MICFACRRRLFATALHQVRARARAPRLPPQWQQTKANLSSASTGISESAQANDDYVPSIDAAAPELRDTRTPARDPPNQYNGTSSEPRFSAMHRRRLVRRQGDDSKKENSLEIFEKVVRNQIDQEDSALDLPPKSKSPAVVEFYNNLARLRPMMHNESLETCLEFFLDKIWAACPTEGRNRLLKQKGTFLMRRVVDAKMNDFDNERLPSIAWCMQIFQDLESLSSTKWADAVMSLILAINSRGEAKQGRHTSAEAHKKALAREEALLHDLVDSWIVFHRHRLLPHQSEFRFPHIDEKLLLQCVKERDLLKALRLMCTQFTDVNVTELPAVAIASFVVLTDPLHTNLDIQQKAKPLLEPLGKILATIPIWKNGLRRLFGKYPAVLPYILRRWDSVISQLRQTNIPEVKPATKTVTREPVPTQRAGPASNVIHSQITDALKLGGVEAIEIAWRRFWGPEVRPDAERTKELQGNQELFHYFITAFTALHRPQRSVEVWDSMASIGIKTTLETWTALIEGCRRSKNAVGLENVWKKLLATGAELDDAVWSARIVGLIGCGKPEAGLQALDEMLRLSKFKPNDPAVAKLERKIISVNAAVAALIRLNAMSAAMKVLTWACENGVEPDLFTYNTLLRPMVQQGNVRQVDSLLKIMKDQGMQPDAVTFTVLLDGLIGSNKDASPEEQVQMVNRLFSDMEAAGVHANMETFARMMHLLLSGAGGGGGGGNTNASLAAVDAIRGFIRERGLKASPYIYTILADHYFSQSPPDVAAVDGLLHEAGFRVGEDGALRLRVLEQGRRGLDRVFWERMIKGYASAGEADRAYGLFRQVDNVGSAVTLDTLEVLLRALVRAGRPAEARGVVDTVMVHRQRADVYGTANAGVAEAENGGDGGQRMRGRYWRHAFWGFAVDCGLVSLGRLRQLELGIRVDVPPDVERKVSRKVRT
ncbi:hypothetical protein VMCG_00697 [Cytospora schulzeri]|uniref:Pentacotripeptide-repeat region of PRORP domain-containing protein n=1 Tax=Cytospora schulzeri TaxID=448051 RepID=A0A423X8B1_9PEZI|nr:hypothetical protein VMCG_00697 [Valsa malicola]